MASSETPSPAKCQDEQLQRVWKDLVEKVSVAGWYEALAEKEIRIRRMFQLTLLMLSGCAVYYSYTVIWVSLQSGYKNDITDLVNQQSLPFSNITICAPVYFSRSFIRQNMTVPEHILKQYLKLTGQTIDEFYDELTLFVSPKTKAKEDTPMFLFSKIIRYNPHTQNFPAFAAAAYPTCDAVFKRCRFDGIEFDCCERAVQSIEYEGVCYLLALNFDSDNAAPSPSTFQQTRPGPEGGLTIETALSVADSPMLEEDQDDGFRVYVNAVPFGMIQSPLGAPSQAETFIKVTAAQQLLSVNCAPYGHLHAKGGTCMYYDPEGFDCAVRDFVSVIREYTACEFPLYLYKPNATSSCNPLSIFVSERVFSSPNMEATLGILNSKNLGIEAAKVRHYVSRVEKQWRSSMSNKARCPSHCRYWKYESTASFADMETRETEKAVIRSKIHIYYGELGYRRYEEVKQISGYLAFYSFCSVVFLYWGMSVVSFVHVLYYVPLFCYVRWKRRCERRKVAPAPV